VAHFERFCEVLETLHGRFLVMPVSEDILREATSLDKAIYGFVCVVDREIVSHNALCGMSIGVCEASVHSELKYTF
jgi:hypothetical protein